MNDLVQRAVTELRTSVSACATRLGVAPSWLEDQSSAPPVHCEASATVYKALCEALEDALEDHLAEVRVHVACVGGCVWLPALHGLCA